MKIKAVCEATGLTDRAVRYYIEESLISPEYTENYIGRKNYDFSESDVCALRDIAVLRKYGFSIPEIREMIQNPESIFRLVGVLKKRKQAIFHEEQDLLAALARLDRSHSYTVSEFAAFLADPVAESPLPSEDSKFSLSERFFFFLKSLLILLFPLFPVLFFLFCIIDELQTYHYPKISFLFFFGTFTSLIPFILILILTKRKKDPKSKLISKSVLLAIFCGCILIVSKIYVSYGFFHGSETREVHHYREIDISCPANRDKIYFEMFPLYMGFSFEHKRDFFGYKSISMDDGVYYYRYFDSAYDIYAEKRWKEDDFESEVSRVKTLFEETASSEEGRYCYLTMDKGNYSCHILYLLSDTENLPFEKTNGKYIYYIFAYDKENLKIRYVHCYSRTPGKEQPYYLSLDW